MVVWKLRAILPPYVHLAGFSTVSFIALVLNIFSASPFQLPQCSVTTLAYYGSNTNEPNAHSGTNRSYLTFGKVSNRSEPNDRMTAVRFPEVRKFSSLPSLNFLLNGYRGAASVV